MLQVIAYSLAVVYYITALLALLHEIGPDRLRASSSRFLRLFLIFFYGVAAYCVGALIITSGPFRVTAASLDRATLRLSSFAPFYKTVTSVTSFLLSPTGWQNSHIRVKVGEHVAIYAAGRINIASSELLQTAQRRLAIGQARSLRGLDPDMFSTQELDSITPQYDWIDPEGYGVYRSRSNPGRERTLPMPDASYGALIGLIATDDEPPERPRGEPFLVPGYHEDRFTRDGVLWFNINDVGYYPNTPASYPRNWYRDNLGAILVTVIVTN